MSSGIILSISTTDERGRTAEVTITEDNAVLYRSGEGQPVKLSLRRREVDDFVWEVEGFVEDWEKQYGEGVSTDPHGWMVLLERDRHFNKYQGCGEYPPDWAEFLEMIDDRILYGQRK